MRRLGVSGRHLFETVEKPALSSLPGEDYEFAEWRLARVSTDYHAEFDRFFYSVPHSLIRQQVDIRATQRTIEIFLRGKRIAIHQRRYGGRRYGTIPDHMPSSHRRYAEWTPDRFRRWAASIGPQTEGLIAAILASRRTLSRASEHVWGCSGFTESSAMTMPKRYRPVRSRSAGSPARVLPRSLPTIKQPGQPQVPAPSWITSICVAPVTSIKETKDHVDPSHTGPVERAWPSRHGQSLPGPRCTAGNPRPRTWRMARHPSRA
ncbi:Mu transposase domain-containing protein [Martelella mediterranea]|uniref:Mu transposase domain-containing protein n=1 Tax=Martelella mediterranea TaxID=293089 RepID=UPI003AAB480E